LRDKISFRSREYLGDVCCNKLSLSPRCRCALAYVLPRTGLFRAQLTRTRRDPSQGSSASSIIHFRSSDSLQKNAGNGSIDRAGTAGIRESAAHVPLGQLDWLATHARPSCRASFVWHYSNPRVHCLQRRIEDGGLVLLHCAQLMTDRQTECGVAQCNDRYLPTSCSRASRTPSHLSLGIIIYGSRD